MKKLCSLLFVLLFVFVLKVNAQSVEVIPGFDIQVPNGFNHDTQVDVSAEKAKKQKDTYFYCPELNSANFSKVKTKLVPGEIYVVKFFPMEENVSIQQCLSFLKDQKALLVGPQGLTLIYDLAKDKLPKDKSIISFATKEELEFGSSGNYFVPYLQTNKADNDYAFRVADFKYDLILKEVVLICVIKKG